MAEITSTRERLLKLLEQGINYEVQSTPIYMPQLNGWLVTTTVVKHIGDEKFLYQSNSFRKIEENSVYTALETADTVSLGRCLAKMGIGIDSEFASADEFVCVPKANIPVIDETPTKAIFPAHINKEVETKDGKKVVINTDGDHHDDAVALKLAIADGDVKTATSVMEDIKEVIRDIPELIIPPKQEVEVAGVKVLKRNLKEKESKELWAKLKAAGGGGDNLNAYIAECGLEYKDFQDFMRLAEDQEIMDYYYTLTNK